MTQLVPGPVNCQGSTGSCPRGALIPARRGTKINKCIVFFSQQIDCSKWVKRKLEEGNSKAGSAFVDKVVQAFLWRQQLA